MRLFYIFVATVAILFAVTTASPDGICRILMSSGGGDRIYFEFGALTAFHSLLGQKEITYDVVTGISAGSLLSGLLSRWKVGDESAALQQMSNILWAVKQRSDIIADWPGGWWEGLTQHSGMFDSTPLLNRINEWILTKPYTDRRLRIGAVDQLTGKLDIFHENSENLNLGILGSCSVPGIFPVVPVTFKNGSKKRYVDGGVKSMYLVEPGLEACLDAGYKEEDIIIDTLLCYTVGFSPKTIPDDMKTVESLLLSLEISSFQNGVQKLEQMMKKYPKAHFRNIIMPDANIGPLPSVGLNFDFVEMRYMYERGLNDTKIQFDKFPQGNAADMMKKFLEQTRDNHISP